MVLNHDEVIVLREIIIIMHQILASELLNIVIHLMICYCYIEVILIMIDPCRRVTCRYESMTIIINNQLIQQHLGGRCFGLFGFNVISTSFLIGFGR